MKLNVVTYNIDGLPEQLDLNDLPALLKPISWIYKWCKKTTIVKINDNENTSKKIEQIGKCLIESNGDLIGVQEDFNYHDELVKDFYDKYSWGSYSGGFDISKVFSSISWFPPRFKADGINLFAKVGKVKINEEEIIKWNKSYGYIDHANDKLTTKGFRFYNVTVNEQVDIDIYIVHMDADFYNAETCPDVSKDVEARKSQFEQLVSHIIERYYSHSNPVIIMGDTNSYNKYTWDVENICNFMTNINYVSGLDCKEAYPENFSDCDRIFYINADKAKYKLKLNSCKFNFDFDTKIGPLSDHKPLEAEFEVVENI